MGSTSDRAPDAHPDDEVPVLVVMGGPAPWPDAVPRADLVVAADSGVDHAHAAGLHVDVVVGDLDSVSADGLERAVADGAVVERHPPDKDETDLELAMAIATADRPAHLMVIGGAPDDRIDHWLAALGTLAAPRWRPTRVEARLGRARVHVVHDRVELDVTAGATISLLAVGGTAEGVTTSGLSWPLDDEPLPADVARGVSNIATDDRVTVEVRTGTVLVVVPGPGGA